MHHLNLKTQLKKNSGPLNDVFEFIQLHLTFKGDVVITQEIKLHTKIL